MPSKKTLVDSLQKMSNSLVESNFQHDLTKNKLKEIQDIIISERKQSAWLTEKRKEVARSLKKENNELKNKVKVLEKSLSDLDECFRSLQEVHNQIFDSENKREDEILNSVIKIQNAYRSYKTRNK
tara:strand:- start:393 stop:770 length:378 start_codon:yes stop_codon:yes gene_type:complete